MTSKHYRWIQESPSPMLAGEQPRKPPLQLYGVRNRATHPLARWRMAVAVAVEPMILAIIPLLLWGMVGAKAMPTMLGIALTISVVLLVVLTLILSAFAADARAWQPGDGR